MRKFLVVFNSIIFILILSLGISLVLNLNNEDKKQVTFDFNSITRISQIGGGQDGAIYNDKLFSFGSSGECTVYNVNDWSVISNFTLDKSDILAPHSNSVCFGNLYYDKADEYPLLYSNIYNNNASFPGVVNVYRIIENNSVFSSELVQVIKVAFTDDPTKWASGVRPYGNFVVDTDKGHLWAFVMDDTTRTTKFFSFSMPALDKGIYSESYGCRLVSLEYGDIKKTFSTKYFNYLQGCCYYDGKIYSSEGFTNDGVNVPTLRVIDLTTERIEKSISLPEKFNLNVEPEFLYVYNGLLYYKDVVGNLYSFKEA